MSKESVVESEEEKQEAQEPQNMDDHVQKAEEDTIHTTELPMEEYFEDSRWARTFQKMRLKSEIFYPFEGQNIECIRMEIKDIHEFPEKYWYLGNNSFLLHGFFQYGYFVLGCQSCSKSADNLLEETDETSPKEYFIGVPGVFQNPERMMATMFGFPEFRAAKKSEYKTGNFGYWYRII